MWVCHHWSRSRQFLVRHNGAKMWFYRKFYANIATADMRVPCSIPTELNKPITRHFGFSETKGRECYRGRDRHF
ncbi:hypothetical protein CEXT_577801 [Caerostris extrusa]|uniref:Uncharacterized protein n=1 Tax=Caerostris extrusa TaxID=172846 RepID=A0AAV4XL96_CAEEX|nr:hypothetical protein CEXT_577801 [Caerostris extrusa]